MAIEYRAITEDELPEFMEVDRRGFGVEPRPEKEPDTWARAEIERTRAAVEAGEIVGMSRAYSFELTMPGGACVPAAAVSAVSVQPTHRRRGVLTGMIGALHDDARARGEIVSMLTASESVIYGRFGYGCATWRLGATIERTHAGLREPVDDPGRVRFVNEAEARKVFPEVYERIRPLRAGAVSRPDFWWPEMMFWEEPQKGFSVIHENERGIADGFVMYDMSGEWTGGITGRRLRAWDIQAETADARAALWQYLLGIDLIATIAGTNLPADEPLRFLLADPRRLRVDYLNDSLWLLPLDVAALLASRVYGYDGGLVIEVHGDADRPATRYALDAGPAGATCAITTAAADLACSISTLGALTLGGNSWSVMSDAGLVTEERAGAVTRADAMFATAPVPATLSNF